MYLLKTADAGQVAAKILDPETAGDHESRKRFVREAELALGVKHPNLVETYDVGEDPDIGDGEIGACHPQPCDITQGFAWGRWREFGIM